MIRFLIVSILALLAVPYAWATIYYVDSSVGSSGNGLAWATAWKNTTNITGLAAGDIVYFSGGTVSQTYPITGSMPLTGGSSGNPVTYAAGQDPGHNGLVIFTATGTWINNPPNWVTIDGQYQGARHIQVASSSSSTETVVAQGKTGIVIKGVIFPHQDSINANGTIRNYEIANNELWCNFDHVMSINGPGAVTAFAQAYSFHGNTVFMQQEATTGIGCDGIQNGNGGDVYNNTFSGTSLGCDACFPSGQHQDGIQTDGIYMRIYNNVYSDISNYSVFYELFGSSAGPDYIFNNVIQYTDNRHNTGAQQGIAIGNSGGVNGAQWQNFYVLNNTIINVGFPGAGANCVTMRSASGTGNGFTGTNFAENNMCYGVSGGNIFAAGITLANNIVTSTGAASDFVAYQIPTSTPFAYNVRLLATATTLIGQGTNQTALGIAALNSDADGAPRPSFGGWDIGAFEFQTPATITASANSCTSGFSGCTFTATIANAPTIVRVVYTVDAYSASTFIPSSDSSFPLGPLSSVGASLAAPWTLAWNTFNVMNGPHLLIATGYDALGAVVATSSAVNFTVANTTPVSCVPAISVSTGTPLGSPWSGSVNMTVNVTGGCVGDVMVYRFNIDGVNQFASSTTTSNTFTFPLDTTQFTNGPHVPSVTLRDFTHFLSFPPPPATATAFLKDAAEWSRVVTFANSSSPAQLVVNQRETRVTAGSTVSLTCSYLKADGTKSSPTCDWYSEDPSVCTVNASTGVVTVLGGVIGPCRVRVMAELVSGNDLVLNGCSGDCVTSAAHPFTAPYANRVVHITTAGTGCVPGFYEGKSWFSGSNVLDLTTVAGTVGATGCQFTTGPSRTAWILVWPQNIRPYFSLTNDAILTTPVAGQTGFLNSIFTATGAFGDQAYTPGYLADFCNSGYNRLETGVAYTEGQQVSTNQTTAQNSQNSYVATQEGFIAGCSKLLLHGAGEVFAGTSQNLQAATRGALPGFTTPFVQYALGSWHKMPSADMSDEINSAWGFAPLQGPQIFGGANSGLTSISASAGTCTAFCAKCNLNQDKTFVISGATTAGFNSVSPATFLATGVTNTQFNFACPLVATGNYTSANNPTLRIEPFAALWIAGDYVHSDAFRQIRLWDLANPIPMLFTFANAANTNNNGVACWEGNPGSCVPAQNYGGVTSVSDYATIYLTHSDYELYLASRASTNVIIDEVAEGTGVNQLRQGYGTAYSPDLPVLAITQNSPNLYGFQGASAAVTSMVAGVMTFASDISAILPVVTSGISRLSWNGNSYYFLDYNAVTHAAHVLLAKTDFTGQGTGGTLTFSNGNTETVALACLTPSSCGQTNPCSGSTLCGDTISVSADANLGRNRGLTFRMAVTGGSAQVALNANTFVFIPESRAASTTVMYFREVPGATFNCPSSCPAATIIPDNYFVKNRNMYNSTDGSGSVIYNTGFAFSWIFETIIANVAGQRLYKGQGLSQQGYNPATGFVGNWTVNGIFDQTNVQIQQLFGTPHWENGTGTPVFHADSHASLYAQARAKYLLQPALPAPDYTEQFEAAAWGGTNGKALLVANMTDGTQTRTLDFTNYLQSGQGFWCDYLLPDGTWTITTFAAGTTSNAFTFAPNGVVGCMFPTVFAGSLSQPTFRARLADVAGADKIVVRYAYDPYWLDTAIANVVDCGDGTSCTIPADRNVGTIWTRIQYLKSGALVANGDMQTQ